MTNKQKATTRLGETKVMNCGLEAKIIVYRKYKDIDIQFEDGTIVYNREYGDFKKGAITHPSFIKEQKAANRLGEAKIMKCGLEAIIINYKCYNDIDIQFSDGAIVNNKSYGNFIKGNIRHPSYSFEQRAIDRVHETQMMSCGINATIINYRSAADIDIQFEDGIIVKNKKYTDFLKGYITHPFNTSAQKAQNRIGQKKMMNCGINATIIAYRSAMDLDVQFDDGVILTGYRYEQFQKGKIPHEKLIKPDINSRIGEKNIMNCGLEATITEYRKSNDIDIQFEEGTVLKNKYYRDFKLGLIKYPYTPEDLGLLIKLGNNNHINETRLMTGGIIATIIAYRNSNDIDIQFFDKTIITNTSYQYFKNGKCSHPKFSTNKIFKDKIGETRMMNCGIKATIIDYKNGHDITVEFKDGVIQKGYRYEQFKDGRIPHPNYKYSTTTSRNEFGIMYYLKNLGFRKVKQGEFKDKGFGRYELDFYNDKLKVAIEYDGNIHKKAGNYERDLKKNQCCKDNNITVYRIREKGLKEITDGISCNYTLTQSSSKILTPELENVVKEILSKHNLPFDNINFQKDRDKILKLYHEKYHNKNERERLGMNNTMKCGIDATIIAYRNSSDIDIKFKDGTIVKNKDFSNFLKGTIKHPFLKQIEYQKKIGEKRTMNCGVKATIIAYRKSNDIDIQFEDGVILTNKRYDSFKRGSIAYPFKHKHIPEAA